MALPTVEELASQLDAAAQAEGRKAIQAPEVSPEAVTPPSEEDVIAEEMVKTEPAPEPVKVEKKDPISSKFAALSRREKEARERIAEAERSRQDIEERARKLEEREKAIASARRPADILKAHGYSYADVTQDMLGAYEPAEKDPVDVKFDEKFQPILEENKALKSALDEMKSTLAEIQAERVETAKREIVNTIHEVAKQNDCEMILTVGDEAYTLVQEVIRNYYNQHKKVLSFSEACDKVEQYYVDHASKLADTSKIKSRFAPPTPQVPTKPQRSAPKQESPTLTNSLTQGARAMPPSIDKMPKHEALAILATQLRYKD